MNIKRSFLLFSIVILENNIQAADLYDVVRASQHLSDGVKEVGIINSPCKNSVGENVNSNPALKASDSKDVLIVHAIKSQTEYEDIFKETPTIKPSEKNPFYVALIMENDKRFLYESFTKQKSDDVGRTHGMEIHLGHNSDDGVTKDLSLSTYLYSEKIRNLVDSNGNPVAFSKSGEKLIFSKYVNGTPVYVNSQGAVVPQDQIAKKPQHFQEINALNLIVDNIKTADTFYYKAGAGVVMVVSDKPSAFGAAIQQQKWHEIQRKTVYDNIGDGEKDRYGVSALGALGIQKKLDNKTLDVGVGTISYDIKGAMEVGASGTTLSGGSVYGKVSGGVGIGKEIRRGERRFEVSASVEQGKSQLQKIEFALNGEDCSLLVSYDYYRNDEKKYAPLEEGTMHFGSRCHF